MMAASTKKISPGLPDSQPGTKDTNLNLSSKSVGRMTLKKEKMSNMSLEASGGRGETVITSSVSSFMRQTSSSFRRQNNSSSRESLSASSRQTVSSSLSKKPANLPLSMRRSSTGSSNSSQKSLSPSSPTPPPVVRSQRQKPALRQTSLPIGDMKLSKEVLDKIGNRPTKVQQSTKKCFSCLKPLTDDGFFALGQLYHKTCFRCKFCSKKLSQVFFTRDDKPCCGKCHKEASQQCFVCEEKIADDHIFCNKKFYHPRCMKCQVCGEQVRDRYITFKDKPICEKDFKALGHVCSVCEQVITGNVFIIDEAVLCEADYNDITNTGVCSKCNKDLTPDDSLRVGDVMFHHGCLTCEVCNKNMEGKSITMDNKNRIYCTDDYTRKFSSMCAGCKKMIVPKKGQNVAPRIRALGKDYHLSCFKCRDCSLVLDSRQKGKECWPVKEHLYCYKCYRRRQSESEEESDCDEA